MLLVAGWMTVADWIGSNERFFPLLVEYTAESSRARAEEALREIRWGKGSLRAGLSFAELFRSRDGGAVFEPNPLQSLCMENIRQPGLY